MLRYKSGQKELVKFKTINEHEIYIQRPEGIQFAFVTFAQSGIMFIRCNKNKYCVCDMIEMGESKYLDYNNSQLCCGSLGLQIDNKDSIQIFESDLLLQLVESQYTNYISDNDKYTEQFITFELYKEIIQHKFNFYKKQNLVVEHYYIITTQYARQKINILKQLKTFNNKLSNLCETVTEMHNACNAVVYQ
ncbi:Hypothetical_protein [Hexamita inflata]|uniref:Hypothetical_protein n=1 Tax=Hexamita inflata TaxID=28002 RepID=A0ABP1H266_9EUKA